MITVNKEIKIKDVRKYILNDAKVRREIARRSHFGFFCIYLAEYIKYPTAAFQRQMFEISQDDNIKAAAITAFRGSGKSTIMSLSFPIWAMIARKKRFIVILSQNQDQCELILSNIRAELEKNELLVSDFGPFKQISVSAKWSQETLLVSSYDCMITCISSGGSIRGIRYKQHRPDLIIFDDVEDMQSTRTKEGRDKTFNWFSGEVVPTGDVSTKMVVIGNKLHEDGLMMKLKKAVTAGNFSAEYKEYPLLDEAGRCLWPEKFKTQAEIDYLKRSLFSEAAWQREYLLKIVPEDDAVILRDWIRYYDSFPEDKTLRYIATGIDLAISKSASADYTAMVSAYVYDYNENLKIYILAHPVNKRMSFPETVEATKELSVSLGRGHHTRLYIEDVGYQRALVEELAKLGYPAEGVKVMGSDKRQRLALTAPRIKNGSILFPKKGCEQLIGQLVGFGYESHDDLSDAFAILIIKIIEESLHPPIRIGRA